MRVNKLRQLATLFAIIVTVNYTSGQYSLTTDTFEIDEVVVTGTPIKVNRNNLPMAVSVIDKAQLEETNESALLPVLNGRVPGLFVTERGITGFGVANGSAGQISVRGIGGNPTTGVLMLIDGHPQFMGIMGHPLPDSYVASDAERVEVIRGPASILYGSNAMGGVINIITRKQQSNGFQGNARISRGSFNTQKYMGSAGFKKNKISAFVSVNHDNTDGHRDNSEFSIVNGYAKLSWDMNPHFYISTDLSLAGFDASDPGPDTLNAKPGEKIDILRGYWALTLQNEFEKSSGSVKLYYNFGEHDITDGFHSNDHNYGFSIYESFRLFDGNNITLGLDHANYGGLAENVNAMNGKGIVFADTAMQETGIYGFVQQEWFDRFTLNAGLRYQNHNIYGNQWIPSAGFTFDLSKSATWKGNISKGFRSPMIRELYMWGPKNPDLQPETVKSIETGVSKKVWNNKLKTELTVFSVSGDNMITLVPVNGIIKYMNTGEISNKGIELSVDAVPQKNLTVNATYSLIDMKNPVYATPEHHLYLHAGYQWKKVHLSGSIQQVVNLDNDATPVTNQVDYTLLQAKAVVILTDFMKFHISADNLLNQKYEVNRYYTMPGTTVFAGINLMFK